MSATRTTTTTKPVATATKGKTIGAPTTGTPTLRKRMRVLGRTYSGSHSRSGLLGDKKVPSLVEVDLSGSEEGHNMKMKVPLPLGDDESRSGSSDTDDRHSSVGVKTPSLSRKQRPSRPAVNTSELKKDKHGGGSSPMSPNSRAWYEFDLAVVVALVSPLGNWLTGTDHVKNFLLIMVLIFYLHQIIEVPWTLYQNARPRARAPDSSLETPEKRIAHLASSELQKLELFFLALTVLSPLAGAALLRYASDALLGPAAVSWFSTGLFVLATGMRPWAHLCERLSTRTHDLHDTIHYASAEHAAPAAKLDALVERVTQLEAALARVRDGATRAADDSCAYVDDAVDAVEAALRAQERRWARIAEGGAGMERRVAQLEAGRPNGLGVRGALAADVGMLAAGLRSVATYALPAWVLAPQKIYAPVLLLGRTRSAPISQPSSAAGSPTTGTVPLETIFEEEVVDRGARKVGVRAVDKPYYLASTLLWRVVYLATLPIRAIARMVLRNY